MRVGARLIRNIGAPVRRLQKNLSQLPATGPSFADFLGQAQERSSSPGEEDSPILPPRRYKDGDKTASSSLPRERLTDRFGRFHGYLRVSLTERCNLRCQYCMPADGVASLTPSPELLAAGEIVQVARAFSRCGGSKIRLTGGEPTLRRDVVEICEALSQLKVSLGMTTNGVTLLSKKDGKTLLEALVEAQCTSFNISLDSLDAEAFAKLSRRPPATHGRVLASIDAANALAGVKVKVNCVVMRGSNDAEMAEFARFFAVDKGIDVRFIEWMPFASNDWDKKVLVPYKEMLHRVSSSLELESMSEDDPNSTTKWFSSKGKGRVGFITSMTEHFCGTCNRVRVTADGSLKTCLFGRDALSLRDIIRTGATDEDLTKALQSALGKKHFKHGGHEDVDDLAGDAQHNRPMVHIGG